MSNHTSQNIPPHIQAKKLQIELEKAQYALIRYKAKRYKVIRRIVTKYKLDTVDNIELLEREFDHFAELLSLKLQGR